MFRSSVVSPIENFIRLKHALGSGWARFGTYGDELLAEIPLDSPDKYQRHPIRKCVEKNLFFQLYSNCVI